MKTQTFLVITAFLTQRLCVIITIFYAGSNAITTERIAVPYICHNAAKPVTARKLDITCRMVVRVMEALQRKTVFLIAVPTVTRSQTADAH